ncbi:Hypothetical protein, putative [Bodo saltans]|uniref:Uncharacterized protein n=1 Tax=Bodo saltans TaxID=75058 RepID=A0A0S4J7S7_BODSA|nr:Hypothetical protein, putative [Bodo saltans]|eukprot:CUG84843.1 Hypothetical protein, putative [Bodo saltans]
MPHRAADANAAAVTIVLQPSADGMNMSTGLQPQQSHQQQPAARHTMFLEIVRDDRDQSLTLNFRRKGRPVDGQAFYCLCRADVAADPTCLFQRLASSTSALKRFAVQSDMFHHTGVLECGYCTVTASVGTSKLHRIHPNVPYLVALAIHGDSWTKRALGGGGGPGAAAASTSVSGSISPATTLLSPTASASGVVTSAITVVSSANQHLFPPSMDGGTLTAATTPSSQQQNNQQQQPAVVFALGDDPIPFVERVVLRELRDQGSRIRPAFHMYGRSPWNDNLIPSLDCVRYLSIMTHNFLKKNSIHLQSIFSSSQNNSGGGGSSSPSSPTGKKSAGWGNQTKSGKGSSPLANARRPLLQRQLTIHGVADPLCGAVVSFLLSASDAVQQFRKKAPTSSTSCQTAGAQFSPNASRTSAPSHHSGGHNKHVNVASSSHAQHSDGVVSGSPRGTLPTAGDLLDAISALGSRAQSSTSLSSSWVIDWFDILLLCTLDAPSLKRVGQAASQFKLYDIEGQPIQARLQWMLRPEKHTPPRGALTKLFMDEAARLELEKMNPTTRGSGSYVPCVLSPARAVWTWMPHRQQVRALYYAVALPPLIEAVEHAKKQLLNPALVQPLYRKNRREHARRRLSVWIHFVLSLRKRRASMMERQYSQSTSAPLLLSLAERAENTLLQVYMMKWYRHRITVRFMAPMDKHSEMTHLRYRFRVWRIASTRQYNIRVPRHLTIAVRGEEGLLPIPKMWARCIGSSSSRSRTSGGGATSGTTTIAQWNVLHDLGDGRGVQCTTVTRLPKVVDDCRIDKRAHRLLPTHNRITTTSSFQSGSSKDKRNRHRDLPTTARPSPLPLRQDFCGANVQLYFILQRLTEQRNKFIAYRLWRAFAEVAKHYRQQQVRQIKAVHVLAAHLNPTASSNNLMSRRVWFVEWKRWAQHRHHQRNIVQQQQIVDDDTDVGESPPAS